MKNRSCLFGILLLMAGVLACSGCLPGNGRSGGAVELQYTEMVLIPESDSIMGTSEAEANQLANEYQVHPGLILLESPKRTVHLKAFYIDRFPVTNRQFEQFCAATGHAKPWGWGPEGKVPPGMEDNPVVDVSWKTADEYSKWAGKRLPTAEEWEKAARGCDGRLYPWGNQWNDKAAYRKPESAFMPPCIATTGTYTLPVGCYPEGASPYGVMDMVGNVQEWTATRAEAPGAGPGQFVGKGAGCSDTIKCFYRCASVAFNDCAEFRGCKGFRCVKDGDKVCPEATRQAQIGRHTIPPFPQPTPPREDLYGKAPITLGGGPSFHIPYLPDGALRLMAPEGFSVKVGEPDTWLDLMPTPHTDTGWKFSPDKTRLEENWAFTEQKITLRIEFESHLDYVDYRITVSNNSPTQARTIRTNTCQLSGYCPYIYDQEDARTYIFTDSGPRRWIECPPFAFQAPLFRGMTFSPPNPPPAAGAFAGRVPLICTVSPDGKWVLAVACLESSGVSRNANYSCLHMNPIWPMFAPDMEHTILTRYYVLRGGTKEAQARFEKDFPKK